MIISKIRKIEVICSINKSSYQRIRQLIQQYQLDYIVDDSWNYSAKVSDEQPIYHQLAPSQLAQNINMIIIDQPIKIILLAIPAQFYPIIY